MEDAIKSLTFWVILLVHLSLSLQLALLLSAVPVLSPCIVHHLFLPSIQRSFRYLWEDRLRGRTSDDGNCFEEGKQVDPLTFQRKALLESVTMTMPYMLYWDYQEGEVGWAGGTKKGFGLRKPLIDESCVFSLRLHFHIFEFFFIMHSIIGVNSISVSLC